MVTWARVGIAISLAGATACALIVGIDDHDFQVRVAPDVTVLEAGTCGVDSVPTTTNIDSPNGTDHSYVVAFEDITFYDPTDPTFAGVGFNLDFNCTCHAPGVLSNRDNKTVQLDSPELPRAVGISLLEAGACDQPNGNDNALGALLVASSSFAQFSDKANPAALQATEKRNIRCGNESALFIISEYNGLPNDSEVVVSSSISYGIYTDTEDGGFGDTTECGFVRDPSLPREAHVTYPARFDGHDVWTTPTQFHPDTNQLDNSQQLIGTVTNYTLVIDQRGSLFTLPLGFGGQEVPLTTPVVVAKIVPQDANGKTITDSVTPATQVRLENGTLGGRVSVNSLLQGIGTLPESRAEAGAPLTFLCSDDKISILKAAICGVRDIASHSANDNTNADCDAVSVGVRFNAGPAAIDPGTPISALDASSCGAIACP